MRALRFVGASLLVMVAMSSTGAAAAWNASWISWRMVAHFGQGLSGISCPSALLCVAGDASGRVASSTEPASVRDSWASAQVDGGNYLAAVSCPTEQMCAALDRAGHVVLSANPTGGSGAWVAASAPIGATGLSCPAAGFCAATAGGYVYVTSDPAAGVSGWAPVAGGDQGPECGKYGGTSDCFPASVVVSCPSVDFCAAGDSYGNLSTSTDPLGGIAAWRGGGPSAGEYDTLSCPSGSLCVGSCPTGVGFNGQACSGMNYDAGTIVSWNPATWQVSSPTGVQFAQISTQPLTGVWCESNTLCFATNGNLLYGTVNPDGGASGWRPIANATSVDGVACPSPTRCDAVTNGGAVLLGSPPPTKAQIVSLLRREISPRRTLRASVLLHRGGYSFVFNAPTAGRLHISWYVLQRTGNGSGVLVGAVSHRYPGPTTDTLKLKLTPEGARVLTRPNTRLLVTASFNAPGAAVTTKRPLAVR